MIPINHDSHRAGIIISCAGWCHFWEICRNNFGPQCNGEERKLRRCIICVVTWPRWRYLAAVVPPSWQRKWVCYGKHSHGFELLRSPSSGCIYWKPNFNQRNAPFMSFLYVSKSRHCFHLHCIHDRNTWCFLQSAQPSVIIYIICSIFFCIWLPCTRDMCKCNRWQWQ